MNAYKEILAIMQTVGKKSIITKATTTSKSLRATIPQEIVEEMGLQAGDVLDWEVVTENSKRIAKARKLE